MKGILLQRVRKKEMINDIDKKRRNFSDICGERKSGNKT